MKVLVAIKDATCARAVTRVVQEQIRRDGTSIQLLTVVDPYPSALAEKDGTKEHPDFYAAREEQRRQATTLLESTALALEAAGFDRPILTVREGDPCSDILDEGDRWHADMIVLGSHGPANIFKRLIGSVPTVVARDASCAVEIVKITT
jgi:nucleotide-binding universal stress UspA family protein